MNSLGESWSTHMPSSLEHFSLLFTLTPSQSEIPADPLCQSHVQPDLLEAP